MPSSRKKSSTKHIAHRSTTAAMSVAAAGRSLKILATYSLGRNTNIFMIVARGSVVDFVGPKRGAIVNAANEGCLGGGGVDGAITAAGGVNLARDRLALPLISSNDIDYSYSNDSMSKDVRCPTGSAVTTGPGDYGDLRVPFVVHAVGPNYRMYDRFCTADQLLRSAYQTSMDQCEKNEITDVAFSLLSAGVYRGRRDAEAVLRIGVEAIRDWSIEAAAKQASAKLSVQSVTFCGFSENETDLLLKICETEFSK